MPEDELIPLSKEGGFAARHVLPQSQAWQCILTPLTSPAGESGKAGTNVAGRNASHHQTSYATAQLTQAMVKSIVDSGLVPKAQLV